MTYRERRLRKADRLRGWAETRRENAAAALATGDKYRGDHAFNTQPGHIPERARLIARHDRAFGSLQKADRMASRAAGIEAAADRAIYSDDPDACEQLRARIATLEASRDAEKAINAAYRVKHRDRLKAITSTYERHMAMPYPPYHFQNLSGNITRQRQRLASLERAANGHPDILISEIVS